MLRTVVLTALLGCVIPQSLPGAPPEGDRQAKDRSGTMAEPATSDAVAAALERELTGDNAARLSALRERLAAAPEDASVHWHLGEVRVGDAWLPYDKVADHGERWRELYRYREERAKRGTTVADQLFLADGARAHKLVDEERAHLTQVVALDPAHEEAHQRLGDILANRQWIPRETAVRSLETQIRWNDSLEDYGRDAARLAQRLRRLSAQGLSKLADPFPGWKDPARIWALEQAVADPGDPLQRTYVTWLGGFDCYEATLAIVRQAIFSEHAEIRLQAAQALKARSPDDYLRELIASIQEIQVSPETQDIPAQGMHATSFEWKNLDTACTVNLVLRYPVRIIHRYSISYKYSYHYQVAQLPEYRQLNGQLLEICKADAEVRSMATGHRNSRVLRALSTAVDRPIGTPQEAWKLWNDAADTEPGQARVSMTYDENWYLDRGTARRAPVQAYTIEHYRKSCLAAGTPIVTETGPRGIETIEPGDRVLSQDIETGELAFKPVFARTTREKAKLIRLKTADNEVVCSQGHPFWVDGIGWVQARGLTVGMRLHTVLGATEVASVEPAGEGTVYNLVVADSHSYFVGREKAFLSHDVTHRRPTNALVPGLQPLWLTPDAEVSDKPLTSR